MSNITALPQLLVSWLNTVTPVTAIVSDRISTVLDVSSSAVFPAVVVWTSPVTIAGSDQSANSDREDWTAVIYCYGYRLSGGSSDLPDNAAAWNLADAVVGAMGAIDTAQYVGTLGTLVAFSNIRATPAITDGNFSRITVTAKLRVWRA